MFLKKVVFVLVAAVLALPMAPRSGETALEPINRGNSAGAGATGSAERLVLAYYYQWFDRENWNYSTVSDIPQVPYNSDEPDTMARHVEWAKNAGIDALIPSWLGPGNRTDNNFAALLNIAQGYGFRAGIDFEPNSPLYGNKGDIINALRYLISKYGQHPAYLKHQGKPVIFFWALNRVPRDGGETPQAAWASIRQQVDPGRNTVWIAEGTDFSYLQTFDGQHGYSIAWSPNVYNTLNSWATKIAGFNSANGTQRLWVATAMPGYNDLRTGRSDAYVRDREGGKFYATSLDAAIKSNPDWIIITSFNEWIEGSQIEPSVSYQGQYLSITKQYSTVFKGAPAPVPVSSAPSRPMDYDIPGGHFFTQANGSPLGTNPSGFSVTNEGGIPFWNEYQRLGGLDNLGYPRSRRFQWNGFTVQVMQKGVLQWRPEAGQAWLVNIFDLLHDGGKDDWLYEARSVARPVDASVVDAGKSWSQVVQARTSWLDPFPAIRSRYFASPDALTFYGLPTAPVVDFGNHYSVRLQRAVVQQWKEDVPWARAGDVVVANGGDVAWEAGLFPADSLVPLPAPQ